MKSYLIEILLSFSKNINYFRLDTGWVIKIGRGLDYFKPHDKFTLGYLDMDLRRCHETVVNIFHKKHTKTLS